MEKIIKNNDENQEVENIEENKIKTAPPKKKKGGVFVFLLMFLAIMTAVFYLNYNKHEILINGYVYKMTPGELQSALDSSLATAITQANNLKTKLVKELDKEIDAHIDKAKGNVSVYADWHYSMKGGLLRASSSYASKKINEILFESNSLEKFNEKLLGQVKDVANKQDDAFVNTFLDRIEQYKIGESENEDLEELDIIELFQQTLAKHLNAKIAQGQIAGAVTLGLGLSVTANKAATKHVNKMRAAKVAGRSTNRVAAVCVATGPAVLACGAVVFTVTTLASEYSILKIDQALNREELENNLIQELENIRGSLKDLNTSLMSNLLVSDTTELSQQVIKYMKPIEFF